LYKIAEMPVNPPLGFRPLYRQVREALVARIAVGEWQPGELLPSEPELAAGLGVSPGTVRKALDAMEAENLIVRRQGRGTFLARHDDARILFQFFKLSPDRGGQVFPQSRVLAVLHRRASARAGEVLGIAAGAPVIAIDRVRELGGKLCVSERITLPQALFADLAPPLPNNLYEVYATRFGVTIARAEERLKAVLATKRDAALLGVAEGAPLLQIDRTAHALDGRPAEWRVSRCDTAAMHYLSDLR